MSGPTNSNPVMVLIAMAYCCVRIFAEIPLTQLSQRVALEEAAFEEVALEIAGEKKCLSFLLEAMRINDRSKAGVELCFCD